MKHLWRKIVSVILALAMVILSLPENLSPVKTALADQGDPAVKYIDENGSEVTLAGSQYTLLETTDSNDSRPNTWGVSGQKTYYVVGVNEKSGINDKRVLYKNNTRVKVAGEVILILPDILGNSEYTYGINIPAGINVPAGASLTIYGGPNGGCSLTANGTRDNAGIGGSRNYLNRDTCGTIRIYGGTVTATGGEFAAGIGDGYSGNGGTIIIGGGTVTAKGGSSAAGIGGGEGGTITITGGTITATGGKHGAGIGGGYYDDGGTITIAGGTVSATGGEDGAGIGGGDNGNGGNITISGGTIKNATGGSHGAGIGGGNGGNGGTVLIKNSAKVTANGGSSAAGIGGGRYEAAGNVTIEGGEVNVVGGNYAAGIGGGYYASGTQNITITGGKVTVSTGWGGSAIGCGQNQNSCGKITISGGTVDATAGGYLYSNRYFYYTAAIGGRFASGDKITISGGTVTTHTPSSNNSYCTGIGAIYGYGDSNIEITGGEIVATGTIDKYNPGVGIGDGAGGTGGKVSINITKDGDSVTANSYRGTVTLVSPVTDVTSDPNIDLNAGVVSNLSTINGKKLVKHLRYTIKFVNYNGDVLQAATQVKPGVRPTYNGAEPKRNPSQEFSYEFSGWKDDDGNTYAKGTQLPAATKSVTYTATYSETKNYYKVKFVDDDDTVLLAEKSYPYGTEVEDIDKPANPTKGDDQAHTYQFNGWTPSLEKVTRDVVYRATYSEWPREYTIKFVNSDNSELATYRVAYGLNPEYKGETPTQSATAQHTFTFFGWEDQNGEQYGKNEVLPTVGGDMTYKAIFTTTVNEYSVKFIDDDGSTIKDAKNYPYGTAAADIEKPDDPFKDADDDWVYTFAGWTPAIAAVTGDVVYKATYTKATREYYDATITLTWEDEDDRDGLRPESVTAVLYAGDDTFATLTFDNDSWSKNLRLPKNDVKGNRINYLLVQNSVKQYSTTLEYNKNEQNGTFLFNVTNTHETAKVSLTIQKVWDDLGNAYCTRPDELKVSLSDGTKTVKEVSLNAENGWSVTVTELPMYQNHGQEVVYSWTEEVVTGYKLSKNETEGNITTITNKLETVRISGQVTWEMNGYNESLIPDGVNVLILEVGEQVDSIAVPRVDSETVWEYTSKELPKYTSGGDEITYTVGLESIPAGFGVKITGTEIVFTYQPVMTTIEGTVVWDLKDNEEDLIPDEVAVDIHDENGELVDHLSVTPDENGKWSFTSIELPKFQEDGETEIAYRLESSVVGFETTVEGTTIKNTLKTVKVTGGVVWKMQGYEESLIPESVIVLVKKGDKVVDEIEVFGDVWTFASRDLPMFEKDGTTVVTYTIEEVEFDGFDVDIDGTTITNTFIPELTTVSGNVVWELKGNVEELVPESVTVFIKDGETIVKTIEVSGEDGWNYDASELPMYRFDGITPITYTVEAEAVDGFSKAISGTKVTYTLQTVDVTATVIWDDEENNDGFRPATVEVKLLADGEEIDTVSVSESTDWSYCWSNLPKKVGGKEVGYTVTEENVEKYTVENRQKEDNPLAFMITYTHELEMTDVSVQMIWDDSNNKEGFRPDVVIVSLLANGEEIATAELGEANEWKHTWTDYKYEEGKEIKFTVKEAQVANYKVPVIEKISETTFTVTNSRDFEETEVKVTKAWDDSDNEEGFRPDSVTINLVKDGEVLEYIELNAGNDWTYTWKKLQKYENGKAILYTVTEDPVEHYDTSIAQARDGVFTYLVTNHRDVEKTSASVELIWEDTDNKEGFRPNDVTVKLLANDEEIGTATLSEDNEWKYTWTGLNKFANGEEIEYTVEEAQLPNYKAPVIVKSSETEWAYTVTNGRDFEETEVKVTKVWDDSNNEEGFRPGSVTVNLKKGDAVLDSVELNADNNWSYIWTKLQKYENGVAVNYTVTEDPVANYSTQITKATDGTFTYTVKNSRTVEKTQVRVEKIWDDDDNQDGYRPGNVTIDLLANGEKAGTATLSEDNEWKYTWTGLNKFANGEEIKYTVEEAQIENYDKPVVSKISATEWAFMVTNSHKTEETEVEVKKVWNDADDQDGYRPDDVTINLLADGEVIDTVKLSEDNNWSYEWTKLDKKAAGKEIDYTVTEEEVSEYTTEITKAADGTFTYTVTNSHKTEETEVKVTKVWDDADNQDGYRTADVTVNLLADGEVIKTVKLSKENDWTYTWTKLDKKAAGKDIDYTVTEDEVSKYETEIVKASDAVNGGVVDGTSDGIVTNQYNNGEVTEGTDDGTFSYIITNSHTPETISPIVKVVWVDEDNRNGKRPESVDSVLVNDEEESKGTVTLGLETEWTETAKEPVAKYKNGGTPVKYTWTITSELPAGYEVVDTAEDGLTTTITIAYIAKPVKLPLEVVKVLTGREWNEKDAFEFTLAADAENPDGAELPEVTVVNATAETKTVAFDEIVFSKRGTYKFTITETKGTLDGVSYDTVAKEFVVVVEDDGVGSLYIDEVTNKGSVEITNVYSSVGAIQFAAKKVLDGRELKDGEFTFVLKNEAGEVLQTATCDKDGKISFEPIAYTEKDMVVDGKIVATREYTYTISEVKPEGEKYDALIVYDESVKTIKVTLTDNQDGTITADAKTTDANITFTNVKLAEYEITFVDEDGTTVLKAARKYVVGTKAADVEKPVDPTKKEDDSFTYEFSGWTPEISDVAGDVTYKATYKATAKPGVYYLVGDAPSAQKGNGNGLVMQFKRTVKDEITFDQFDGISFNGKVLTKDLYKTVKGSVIITVPQEFINSLPDGKNEVIVTFKDGDPVKVSVEILPAQSSEDDPVDPNKNEEEKKVSPKTADTMVYGWMIVLLGISGVTVLLVIRRRREEEEQIGM